MGVLPLLHRGRWLWKRCKRVIPSLDELHDVLSELFRTYGPLLDIKTGKPLSSEEVWKEAKKVLEQVSLGFVSDPPGIVLYFCIRLCSRSSGDLYDGIRLYRCCQGTNNTKGSVHRTISARFPTSRVSICHAVAWLRAYMRMHNLAVCIPFSHPLSFFY